MSNPFVDYLNSMNNASSNTIAALAESQVLSPFYDKIQIERTLGNCISDSIRNGERITYVLTGHAGDGKTSILVQVLKNLGLLEPNVPLKEEEQYSKNGINLYTVKDMSALPESTQVQFCRKALEAPLTNSSAIVISNTGPLLKCLEEIKREQCEIDGEEFNESKKSMLQTLLLNQLDSNNNELITLGQYHFQLINIARVDNTSFAEKIYDKLLADDLWLPCEACDKKESCHIYFNVQQSKQYKTRMVSFINAFYRYLYENDKRMTIRQMLSQISFAITGNRTCAQIPTHGKEITKFNFLYPNLFFGYAGLHEIDNADQIQGIAYAREFMLDSKALSADYELFVSGNFDSLPSQIKNLAESQYKIYSKKHMNIDEEQDFNQMDYEYRKAIRRLYLFFEHKNVDNPIYNPLYDELFGIGYNDYIRLQNNEASRSVTNKLQKTIVDALYLEMTGTSSKQISELPLTIKRNDDSFQNVLLTTGKLKKTDLKIVSKEVSSTFEDDTKKHLVILRIRNTWDFTLTLPMVIYFGEIATGAISTIANPALTHGISKLKAVLEKSIADEDSNDDGIAIIVNNTDVPLNLKLFIDDKLYIENN